MNIHDVGFCGELRLQYQQIGSARPHSFCCAASSRKLLQSLWRCSASTESLLVAALLRVRSEVLLGALRSCRVVLLRDHQPPDKSLLMIVRFVFRSRAWISALFLHIILASKMSHVGMYVIILNKPTNNQQQPYYFENMMKMHSFWW